MGKDKTQPQPTEDRSYLDETLEDHRDSMWVVAEVEAVLERHPDREGVWLGELQQALTQLHDNMRDHFEREEGGALFCRLPETHPRLAGRLKVLQDEHADLIGAIRSALDRTAELERPELYELRELNAKVQLLVARLQRHEAAENEIVMEAHWDEVGVGD